MPIDDWKLAQKLSDTTEIVDFGVMFSPIKIFWDSVVKKRWRVI
jgi:hypothetical protein